MLLALQFLTQVSLKGLNTVNWKRIIDQFCEIRQLKAAVDSKNRQFHELPIFSLNFLSSIILNSSSCKHTYISTYVILHLFSGDRFCTFSLRYLLSLFLSRSQAICLKLSAIEIIAVVIHTYFLREEKGRQEQPQNSLSLSYFHRNQQMLLASMHM